MRAREAWRAGGLALALVVTGAAGAAERSAEVRVLSGPGATTTVTMRALPDVEIEDRTPGARTTGGPRGPASTGKTFTGELTLFLRPPVASRAAAIDVGDAVVSAVRLFPEPGGTTVTVFVRQPVTYSVSRPSAIGEVRIELRTRTRPVTVVPAGPEGRPKVVRPPTTDAQEVAVDAESLSYDQQTNTLTARGGVTLTRGDTTLTADEVVYDRANLVAVARGHVVLTDPQATVEGDFAHLNMDDESGWVENANATLEPTHFTLGAGRLEKLGGPRYSVANGVFTTCECGGLERPSWSIAGRQTDVRLEGAGVMRGMSFRVKDVPVLYLPYFVFPANTERQSGFLIPRIGYSNRRGFQYEQPFFWAISKSTDATVALDVETRTRLGVIGEYRYELSRAARGQFIAAYFNEQIRGRSKGTVEAGGAPADIPENRFLISGRHLSPFPDGSRFYLDLFAVGDDSFLREINSFAFSTSHDLALRSTRYTTSRTGIIKTWPAGLAWVENVYYQDLLNPQELALQKLPRVTAEHATALLGERVVGRLTGEAVDFQREEGYDGFRADLAPELFVPFRLGRMLNGSVTGRLRETAYHLTDDEQVALEVSDLGKQFRTAPELRALDDDRTRELAEVHGRAGTEFQRVFDFPHLGLEKLKHTIEPEVQYLYVPQTSRPTAELPDCRHAGTNPQPGVNCYDASASLELPYCGDLDPNDPKKKNRPNPGVNCHRESHLFAEGYLFDERDAINRRNFVSYGITTRLLGRAAAPAATPEAEGSASAAAPAAAAPPRELLRATILHGYDVSRPLVGTSHQSDVDLGIRLTPADYLGLVYNTTVNLGDASIRGFTAGGVLRESWWAPTHLVRNYQNPSTLGLYYRFIEKNVNRGIQSGSAEDALFESNGVNEVDGSVYLRLGDYLGFTFLSRYDLSTTGGTDPIGPHFLERDYLLRLISRCNCWVLEAGVADKTNPDERLFRVQFTLIGLGSFGRSPATRNYVGLAPVSELGLRRPAALGGGLGY